MNLRDTRVWQAARSLYHFRTTVTWKRVRRWWLRADRRTISAYLAAEPEPRLQLGCGENPRVGWLNSDFHPDRTGIIHIDASARFPLPDATFDLVFCEHMIEHLPLEGGMNLLSECHRVLRSGGRIRISTPPLETCATLFREPLGEAARAYAEWHFPKWHPNGSVRTGAVMFNDYMRHWGHLFLYDEPTLRLLLERQGFAEITSCRLQESSDPRLRNLENEGRMPPGMLQLLTFTLEAVKP